MATKKEQVRMKLREILTLIDSATDDAKDKDQKVTRLGVEDILNQIRNKIVGVINS